MSIRLRLLLSYTAMLLITVILFVAAVFLIAVAVTGDVRHVRDLYTSRYAVMPLTEPEETVSVETKFLGKSDPEQLLDAAFCGSSSSGWLLFRRGFSSARAAKSITRRRCCRCQG